MVRLANPFERFLSRQPFLVLDGSLSAELEKMGADLNDPLWSARILVEAPHLIRRVHDSYLAAGADVICTATYQASLSGFAGRGISSQAARDLFALSVELASAGRKEFWAKSGNRSNRQFPLIAGSLGPFGAHLADGSEYRGDYDLNLTELMDWHRPQVAALASCEDLDLILFETIPSLLEAKAIVQLLEEFPGQSAAISFSIRNGRQIAAGEEFAQAVESISRHDQVVAVGANCTAPGFITALLEAAASIPSKPLMIYPNSGEYWNAAQHCWTGEKDLTAFSSMVDSWYKKGARIIGGCCRTGPEHIREIRRALDLLVEAL